MYAYTDYKHWRLIDVASDASPSESIGDILPDPTQAQLFADYCQDVSDGVSAWLDSYVNANYRYDGIVSAASYAGDMDPKFNAEGTAAKQWRSDCFKALYAAMPAYAAMVPDQWPTLAYITANLPQPTAYTWEPAV